MFEPFLSVRTPGEGRSLASAVDDGNGGRDAELTFIVPADGTYEVLANAWRGERGDYVISIEHEDRVYEGDEELVKRGFYLSRDILKPYIH